MMHILCGCEQCWIEINLPVRRLSQYSLLLQWGLQYRTYRYQLDYYKSDVKNNKKQKGNCPQTRKPVLNSSGYAIMYQRKFTQSIIFFIYSSFFLHKGYKSRDKCQVDWGSQFTGHVNGCNYIWCSIVFNETSTTT